LPGRPDGDPLHVGEHRRPEGRDPQPRERPAPLLPPECLSRPARRRPHLLADALLLGRRLRLYAALGDAPRRLPGLRGGLRARGDAAPARARARDGRRLLAAPREGDARPPEPTPARPLVAAVGEPPRAAPLRAADRGPRAAP